MRLCHRERTVLSRAGDNCTLIDDTIAIASSNHRQTAIVLGAQHEICRHHPHSVDSAPSSNYQTRDHHPICDQPNFDPLPEPLATDPMALPTRTHIDFDRSYNPLQTRSTPNLAPRSHLSPDDAEPRKHDAGGPSRRRRRREGNATRKRRPSWKKLLWVDRACTSPSPRSFTLSLSPIPPVHLPHPPTTHD